MKYKFILGLVFMLLLSVSGVFAVTDDAIAYYSFDVDVVTDSSGNGNDLTSTNYPTSTTTDCILGSCADFDGTNDYLDITVANEDDDAYSFSFWFYPDLQCGVNSAGEMLFSQYTDGSNRGHLARQSDANGDQLFLINGGSAVSDYNGGCSFETDPSKMFVLVNSNGGDSSTLYINNVAVTTLTLNKDFLINPTRWYVGAYADAVGGHNWFNGRIDELAVWETPKDATDRATLYNSGAGYNPYGAPPPTPFFDITATDVDTSATLYNITVTLQNGSTYTNVSNAIVVTPFNDSSLQNFTISVDNYFNQTFINYNTSVDLIANLTQYPFLYVYDRWTNTSINASANISGTTYYTSNSGVYVPLNSSETVLLSKTGYLAQNITHDFTNSNDLNTSMYQMRFSITATEIITGNTVSPANYTIDSTTATDTEYFYLALGEYNVTFSKDDWFDKTVSFNAYDYLSGITTVTYDPTGICGGGVGSLCAINSDGTTSTEPTVCDVIQSNPLVIGYVAGSCSVFDITDYLNNDAEVSITGVSSSAINMTANNLIGGGAITSFSINISNDNYSYSEVYSTTTGWIALASIQDMEFNITIDATGYALQNVTLTPNATLFNYTFDLYTTNSINITFVDTLTDAVINDRNISVDFIGSYDTYNESTSTGYLYTDLITPDGYVVRYSATGYDESFYYFTMSDRTTQAVTLYLMNSSATTPVTINVFDESNTELESALVKILRFDVESEGYVQVEARLTNFEGQVVAPMTLNTEFYKFIIEYPLGTIVKTTQPSYISGTTLNIQVQLSQAIAENFFNKDTVAYLLTYSNVTESFTFTYSDSQNLVSTGCLNIYRVSIKDNVLVNSSCVSSATGSITQGVTNATGVTYKADALIYYGTERTYLSSLFHTFWGADLFGTLGLFLAVIMTVFIIFVARWSLTATVFLLPLPLIALQTLSIIQIGRGYIAGIVGLSFVIAYILGRKGK